MKKHGHYYNEIGIKISNFRLSVRFPAAPKKTMTSSPDEDYGFMDLNGSNLDHYRSDWTWVPVMSQHGGPPRKVSILNSPLPPPPVPPRSVSPSTAPSSAIPPYPSSTVSRNSRSSRSQTSYV